MPATSSPNAIAGVINISYPSIIIKQPLVIHLFTQPRIPFCNYRILLIIIYFNTLQGNLRIIKKCPEFTSLHGASWTTEYTAELHTGPLPLP
jgi:hypothetical protein